MKRLILEIPVVFFVLLTLAFMVPSVIDWNGYKAQIQNEIKNQAGLDVVLNGDLQFGILPFPRLSAEDIRVLSAQKGQYENLLTLKRADVGLDLIPLLSGRVSLRTVTFVEPRFFLEMASDGTIVGMPDQKEAIEKDDVAQTPEVSGASVASAVSFNSVHIKDAAFSYFDQKTKKETIVEDVSGELSAQSLYGPYAGSGTLLYQGKILNFDLSSKVYDPDSKILPLQVGFIIQPGNLNIKFAGALDFSKDFVAQGQIELALENLGQTLVANNLAQDANFLNAPFAVTGFLSADSKKLEVKELAANLGGQKIGGQSSLTFEPFVVKADLKTEGNMDIQKFISGYPKLKTGSFDVSFSGDAKAIDVSDAVIKINDEAYSVAARYEFQNETKRPVVNITIKGKSFNADNFIQEMPKENKAATVSYAENLKQTSEFEMPFDIIFSTAFDSIFYSGETVSKASAQGELMQNRIVLGSLTVGDFVGSALSLKGEISDFRAMKGIALSGSVTTKDVKRFASYFGSDLGDIPNEINTGSAKFKFSGDDKSLDSLVNLSAAHGDLIVQGLIEDVLVKPQVGRLTVQMKHRNMAEAMQILSKSKEKSAQFSKPMDFFTNVVQSEDGSYALSGIKADLAGILLQGDAKIDLSDAKPYLSGDLRFEDLILSSQGVSVASKGGSVQPAKNSKSKDSQVRWSKDPIDLSGLNAMNADLNISAKKIAYNPWVFTDVETVVSLKDGSLNVKDFKGNLFGGRAALTSTVETAPQPRQPAHISVSAKMERVEIGSMLQAFTGSEIIKASGNMNMDLDIKTSGLSAAALVYDLNGKGNLSGADIVLDGVDVERFAVALSEESKAGDTVMGIWKGASKGGSTSFETLDGAFGITEGIIAIQKLDLDGPQASIFTTGKIDLPNWTVTTKHKLTAKTRGDVPPFEMAFSGPLDNPAQTFGQGVLNDYLQRKVQRKVNSLLTDKLGEKLGLPRGNVQQEDVPVEQNPNDITPADGESTPEDVQQNEELQQQAPPAEPRRIEDMKPEDLMKDVLKGILQ